MKTIIKAAIAALTVVSGATSSMAQTGQIVWHFPAKGGAPYATQAAPIPQIAPAHLVRHAKYSAAHVQMANKTQVIR